MGKLAPRASLALAGEGPFAPPSCGRWRAKVPAIRPDGQVLATWPERWQPCRLQTVHQDPLQQVLHEYFAWATTATMSAHHGSAEDVPDGLAIPRWSLDGLQVG